MESHRTTFQDRIDMHFDILNYDTSEACSMNIYLPKRYTEIVFIFGWQTVEWSAITCEELYEYGNF